MNSGYVRYNANYTSSWRGAVTVKTPIVNYILPTSRLRLALIFITALKHGDLYKAWMKYDAKGKTIKDFMHDIRGNIQGRKFGI